MAIEIKMGKDLYLFLGCNARFKLEEDITMKNYEKPVVELVSFCAEEVMADVDTFALYGHLGYSEVNVAAV